MVKERTFSMHPWVIDVPFLGWSLRANHGLLLLTLVACSWSAARRLRALDQVGWSRARWGFALLAIVPWLGGHLHFVLNNWRYARTSTAVLLLPWNGIHAAGAIIALVIATPLVLWRYDLPLGRVADALLPAIGIGITLARLGCFADGCCFGRPCTWPWCVAFPQPSYGADAASSSPVHPLQLYFAAVGLVLFAFARWFEPRRRYDGQAALIALLLFSLAAAVLEPLRASDDARVYWGPLPQLEWTALAMSVAAMAALWCAERGRRAAPYYLRRLSGSKRYPTPRTVRK